MRAVPESVARREALKRLVVVAAGLAAACTPYRYVVHLYPEAFDTDADLTDRVLRAFVLTVVPGMDEGDRDLVRVFADPAYPFAKYRPFFAADLCRRSAALFGAPAFDQLDPRQRTTVIQSGLAADATARRLYGGAVFLAQIASYAGIYAPVRGCRLIDFDGQFRGRRLSQQTYPHPDQFAARELTATGNPW